VLVLKLKTFLALKYFAQKTIMMTVVPLL